MQLTGGKFLFVNICKFFGVQEKDMLTSLDFFGISYNIRPYLFEGLTLKN